MILIFVLQMQDHKNQECVLNYAGSSSQVQQAFIHFFPTEYKNGSFIVSNK